MAVTETISARLELAADGFTSKIDDATSQLGDLESSAGGASKAIGALGAAAATGAAAALGGAASAAMDFEAAMADVEKVTDPQTANAMGDAIQDMASRIPLAHEELAKLAAQAGRMGAEGEQEVREFTEAAASMGAATVLSAEDAGTALGKLATAIDEPLGAVGSLGDAINEVSNNFATDSEEIVDAAQRSGQALSTLGMESESILGLSAAFNEVSPTSRIAASRMQAVGEAMMDPSNVDMFAEAIGVTSDEFVEMRKSSPEDTMLEIMDAVDEGQLSFDQMSDQLRTETARAFRDTASAGDQMREAMEMSGQAMDEGGSLANELAVETDTLSGQLELFKNRLRSVAIQIGDNLTPILRGLLVRVNGVFAAFEGVQDATDGWAGTIGLLATAVGGAAVAISAFVGPITAVGAAAAVASGAMAAVGAAVAALTSPLLLAAGAVAALAYAFQTDFAGIRTATMRVVNTLRDALQPVFAWFSSDGASHVQTLADHVVRFVQLAEPYISRFASLVADVLVVAIEGGAAAFGTAANVINDVATWIFDHVLGPYLQWIADLWAQHGAEIMAETRKTFGFIQDFVQAFAGAVRPIITHLMEQIRRITDAVLGDVRLFWERHGDQVLTIVDALTDAIMTVLRTFVDLFATVIKTTLALIRGDWSQAWEYIEGYFGRTIDRILSYAKEWGPTFLDWLGGLIGDVIQWFKDLAKDLIGGSIVPDMLSDMLSAFKDFGGDVLGWLGDMVGDFLGDISGFKDDVVGAFDNLVSDSLSTLKGSTSTFRSAGSSLASSFSSGIRSKIGSVKSAASSVASRARSLLPGSDADEGPLSDLSDAGPALTETFAETMTDDLRKLARASTEVALTARPEPPVPGGPTRGRPPDTTDGPSGPEQIVIDAPDDALMRVGELNDLLEEYLSDRDRRQRKHRKPAPRGH